MHAYYQRHETVTTPAVTELGLDPAAWDIHVDDLITSGAHVIALRGAGKANGIAPEAVGAVVDRLSEHIDHMAAQGVPVEIMYDGDEDRPELPDIGYIFGRLADRHQGKGVSFVTAQTQDRYERQVPNGGPLMSATGTPYVTFVFSPDLTGGHARLTQSDKLAQYGRYEQIVIGQTGPTVSSQLEDLNRKANPRSEGRVPVTVIDVAGNPAVDRDIARQLADERLDDATRAKLEKRMVQRKEHPKGFLFDGQGQFALNPADYPNVAFSMVSIA